MKNPAAKIKKLLKIPKAYYYEIHIVEDEERNQGRSIFFETTDKLPSKFNIIQYATNTALIDIYESQLADYAQSISAEEYRDAQG